MHEKTCKDNRKIPTCFGISISGVELPSSEALAAGMSPISPFEANEFKHDCLGDRVNTNGC